MNKKTLSFTLLIVVCLSFFSVLGYALFKPKPTDNTTLNALPDVVLPVLNHSTQRFSLADLPDEAVLINVWGSWCQSCIKEHPFLMSIQSQLPILGINWYDEEKKANQFLNKNGNPFYKILADDDGLFSVAMGIKGAPESFLVKDHAVIAQHRGILTPTVWQDVFAPHLTQPVQ